MKWGDLVAETIKKMKTQLNEYWDGLDKNKKIKIGVISLSIIIGIIILIIIVSKPKYEVLYENLSLKDTANVTKKLDEMNVKWKTGDDETTILVPKDMKNKIKLELASYGLPKEGYGFVDAFNDSSWTMTDYEKKERFKYALQNELASTISDIDGIESAEVYIEDKKDDEFVLKDEDEGKTTASVLIVKSGNKSIPEETVNAIRNLVAGSISMDPEKVSIVDDSGKLLTENGEEDAFELADRYSIKQNLELKIDDSLKNFLENVFGPDNVDVRASVKVNFDSEKTNIVEFSPPIEGSDEGLVRSMEEVEENMVGGSTGDVPGQETNPIEDEVMPDDQTSRYNKASNVINNELNEINREIRKAPGDIESITVAVLVNRDAIIDGELTEERANEIEELVYAATGLDTEQVFVSSDSFAAMSDEEEAEGKGSTLIWIIVASIVAAAIIGFIVYRRKKEKEELKEEMDTTALEYENAKAEDIEELDLDDEKSEMKNQIEKSIEKNPDAVAQLLRTWLNE